MSNESTTRLPPLPPTFSFGLAAVRRRLSASTRLSPCAHTRRSTTNVRVDKTLNATEQIEFRSNRKKTAEWSEFCAGFTDNGQGIFDIRWKKMNTKHRRVDSREERTKEEKKKNSSTTTSSSATETEQKAQG